MQVLQVGGEVHGGGVGVALHPHPATPSPLPSHLLTLTLHPLSPSPRVWTIPPPTIDPYDTYDASVAAAVLEGHQDSVWSLAYSTARTQVPR